jgi:hypothetical protein
VTKGEARHAKDLAYSLAGWYFPHLQRAVLDEVDVDVQLLEIDHETPKGRTLRLIADNYATHKHPTVHAKHPRFNMQPGLRMVRVDHLAHRGPRHDASIMARNTSRRSACGTARIAPSDQPK